VHRIEQNQLACVQGMSRFEPRGRLLCGIRATNRKRVFFSDGKRGTIWEKTAADAKNLKKYLKSI